MTAKPRPFSPSTVAEAARSARLELSDARARRVARSLAGMYALIDRLDEVPLAETPPATAFDARWRG